MGRAELLGVSYGGDHLQGPAPPHRRRTDHHRFPILRRAEVGQADKAERLRDCQRHSGDKLMAYKGRPLNGIWATAPYLHNGSVKSLHELLLAPADRATSFNVGNREFDPVKVGYVDAPSPNGFVFKVRDDAGKPIPGNSNEGHDYGNGSLTDDQRKALVEYMKTL
jgi:hypothetical protein